MTSCQQQARWQPDTVLLDFIGLMHELRSAPGDLKEAQCCYEKALELDAQNHLARANLLRLTSKQHLPPSQLAEPHINHERREGLAWWSRAFYHMRMYQPQFSIQCFDRAVHLLPYEPKLRFYAAKQFLRNHPTSERRAAARELLQPLLIDARKFSPAFQLQLLAESIRAEEKKKKDKQLQQVREKLARAEKIVVDHPESQEALPLVLNFAADGLKKGGDTVGAKKQYDRSDKIQQTKQSPSSFAVHHRAQLQADPADKLRDLETAIQLQPQNYAARMDRLQVLVDQHHPEDAVREATELLQSDLKMGLLNHIRTWVLKGQALMLLHHSGGAQTAFEAALPLFTIFTVPSQAPNPNSPSAQLLGRLQKTTMEQLCMLYAALPLPESRVRLINAHLQVRQLTQATELLDENDNELPDFCFQRSRLKMLQALQHQDFAAATKAQLQAAHYPLLHAQPGDTFASRAHQAPVEAWINVGEATSSILTHTAINSVVFRSSLINNVFHTLSSLRSKVELIDGLKLGLHTLWLLKDPSPSKSPPDLQQRMHQLALRVQELFCTLMELRSSANQNDSSSDSQTTSAANSVVAMPRACVQLAARVLMMMPMDSPKTQEIEAAIYGALGCTAHQADLEDTGSHELARRFAASVSTVASRNNIKAFLPVVASLLRLRATEVELWKLRLCNELGQQTDDVQTAHRLSLSTAANNEPAPFMLLIQRLLQEARQLLDYYAFAFQQVACPDSHAKWKAAKQTGQVVPVSFPCVPKSSTNQQPRPIDQRLQQYVSHPLRFGPDFGRRFPMFFKELSLLQPLEHSENVWLAQLYEQRNEAAHTRPLTFGQLTLEQVVELGSTAATRVPQVLEALTNTAFEDTHRDGVVLSTITLVWATDACSDINEYLRMVFMKTSPTSP